MNNLKTNSTNGLGAAKYLLFVLVLLISACDGGIFGTGGPDDLQMNTVDAAAPNSDTMLGTETGGAASNIEGSEDTTSGGNTVGMEAGDTGAVSATAGTTGGEGSDGGTTGGFTGTGEDSTDGATTGEQAPSSPTTNDTFTNSRATLDSTDARINLINTSTLVVNAVQQDFDALLLLFGDEGVAPNTVSSTATLLQNGTSLYIFNNTQPDNLASFSEFGAENSTFTTLLVRDNGSVIDTIALVSLTTTSDAQVAKVRVIQADTLDDQTAAAVFNLQSAGDNPGGMDKEFGPVSFDTPASEYVDISSGDYELTDSLSRVDAQAMSFEGGNVYTVVVLGEGPHLVVNDTQAAVSEQGQ